MALIQAESRIESQTTEWQIAKRLLLKNRLAMIGFWILVILYFVMIFASFLAPYEQVFADREKNYHPPVGIHFFEKGTKHFHWMPFVYNTIEFPKYSRHYVPDLKSIYPVHFFFRNPEGGSLHLFGVEPPARIFLFGSDDSGRDVFTRILYGSRVALTIGIIGVFFSYGLGVTIGGLSGFYAGKPLPLGVWWEITWMLFGLLLGGWSGGLHGHAWQGIREGVLWALAGAILVRLGIWMVSFVSGGEKERACIDLDNWIQRSGEMLMMFPSLYLLLGLRALIPENLSSTSVYFLIIIILSFIRWPAIARIVRGLVLSIREREFVAAAEAVGGSNLRIVMRHIIPNTLSQIIVLVTLSIPSFILGEAFLSYLDLGIREPQASWGNMLTQAQDVVALMHYPWILLPGLFIFLTVLGFNLLGDGLRDALDPKMRS